MQTFEPWRTVIECHDLSDVIDTDLLANELLSSTNLLREGLPEVEMVFGDNTPSLSKIRDEIIDVKSREYIEKHWSLSCDFKRKSWASYSRSNVGIDLHQHACSHLSSILYLVGNPGDLVVADPRGSALRGYPASIRNGSFGNFNIEPKSGLLVIMPSYLYHYVNGKPGYLRVALATDYFLDHDAA